MAPDEAKRLAAARACDLVESGMRVGLGTGSTAALFVAELGRRGADIVGVPTSEATRAQAESLGIRLATLEEEPELDLTIDGADELDPALNLIKGGGGALLREKLVAAASRRTVVIADASKRVAQLGRFPLPVEIVPFGIETTRRRIAACLERLGLPAEMRVRLGRDGRPFRTDGGNGILDLPLGAIPDPHELATSLKAILGVVEHGLFVDLASGALIGGPDGVIELNGR
jgi:ribose 5-phosphate isomerase A